MSAIQGAAIEIQRSSGIGPLVVMTEEVGLSDPDGLDDPAIPIVPAEEKRQPRRGCITLDAMAATSLGFYADLPYMMTGSLLWVTLEGRVPGWYEVEKIEDLTALRAEGGAHVFLIERQAASVNMRGTIPVLQVSDGGAVQEIAKEQKTEAAVIQENANLGSLEDLL